MSRKRIAVYPGSFDPVTFGHMDIIRRAAGQFDEIVVGVLNNSAKSPLFSIHERVTLLEEALKDLPNVRVAAFEGLSVNFVHGCGASAIIRGLRATTDFEYELQLAQMNRVLSPDIDTVFFITNLQYAYLSSSVVKEVASYRGSVEKFVPPVVERALKMKFFPDEEPVEKGEEYEQQD